MGGGRGSDGDGGDGLRDGRTVRLALPLMLSMVAVTVVEPAAMAVAMPAGVMVATFPLASVQVAEEVTSAVEPRCRSRWRGTARWRPRRCPRWRARRRWTSAPCAESRARRRRPAAACDCQQRKDEREKQRIYMFVTATRTNTHLWGPQDSEGSAICRKSAEARQALSFETNSKAVLPSGMEQQERGKYQEEPSKIATRLHRTTGFQSFLFTYAFAAYSLQRGKCKNFRDQFNKTASRFRS